MRTMFLMDLLYLVRGGVVDMYFGDFATTMSTLMVCIATTYIIYTIIKQKQTEYWGRRIVLIALFGLIICCFVAQEIVIIYRFNQYLIQRFQRVFLHLIASSQNCAVPGEW